MSPSKQIKVLIADDHTLVRTGVESVLKDDKNIQLVGNARDGREAVALTAELKPDVVLMDVGMPGMNGLEATMRLKKDHPSVRVLMLTMHVNREYMIQAFRVGASGYLNKQSANSVLKAAIKAVMGGETFFCDSDGERIKDFELKVRTTKSPMESLTPRQREILQLISERKNTKEIAQFLGLSPKTVEFHRMELMIRLNIFDVPGLVRYAINHGFTPPEA